MHDLTALNGLKNGLSFVISAVSVITFAVAVAQMLSPRVVRGIIIGIGLMMSAVFFANLFR